MLQLIPFSNFFVCKLSHLYNEPHKLVNLFSGDLRGSDLVLEAILEEEVARNARDFFSQAQNQTKK